MSVEICTNTGSQVIFFRHFGSNEYDCLASVIKTHVLNVVRESSIHDRNLIRHETILSI